MVEVRDQKSYVVTIEITNWNYNVVGTILLQ